MNFTVQKQGNDDVLLKWTAATETNVSVYEIELARTETDLQTGHFVKIGEVAGLGIADLLHYTFTDKEADKYGARYYRLKIVNDDGSFNFSPIRSILFDRPAVWQVYPNPSAGIFNLVYHVNTGEGIDAQLIDASGRLVKNYHVVGSGFVQKLRVDLTGSVSGVYLLKVDAAGKKETFKLYKQ
jgi:hypothetical protein